MRIVFISLMTVLSSTVVFAYEVPSDIYIQEEKDSNLSKEIESIYYPVFIPVGTSEEEISTIYKHQQTNNPKATIIIIEVNQDEELTGDETQIMIESINRDTVYKRVIDNQEIKFLKKDVVDKAKIEIQELQNKLFCSHKWDETAVGSPYAYYTKNINSYCYDLMQNITRICRKCDKTESFKRSTATVQHNWVYEKYGHYNYKCTYCGMKKK